MDVEGRSIEWKLLEEFLCQPWTGLEPFVS